VRRTPNPDRRSERSRTDTLAAALGLCAELGYGKVTVEAIAARAGVSKATIYRWWPSKGAIVLEAIDEAAVAAAGFPDTGDIGADVRKQVASVQKLLTTAPTGAALVGVIAETQHDPDLARQMDERLFQPRIDQCRQRLRKAQRDGQVAADADLDMLIDHLYAPLYYRLLLHQGVYPPRRLAAHINHILCASAPGSTS
jgi:AcrR family transcriptional regulator